MNSNRKISIIVPVYNAQQYISKCVDSLVHQTYNNLEIILVNDGSNDGSLSLCRSLEKEFKTIRVYHQENEGVSSARNLGLSMAKGDIISFVDADDWVEESFAQTIANELADYDILIFDGYICKGASKKRNNIWLEERDFSSDTGKNLLVKQAIAFQFGKTYTPKYHGVGIVWGKAYTRNLLVENNITYNIGQKLSEDAIFTMNAIASAVKIKYIPRALYNYRNDNVSATRSFDKHYMQTNTIMVENFEKFLNDYELKNDLLIETLNYRKMMNIISILDNYLFLNDIFSNIDEHTKVKKIFETGWIVNILKYSPMSNLTRVQRLQIELLKNKKIFTLKCFYNTKKLLKKMKSVWNKSRESFLNYKKSFLGSMLER